MRGDRGIIKRIWSCVYHNLQGCYELHMEACQMSTTSWGYEVVDPFVLKKELWPDVQFYNKQCEIIQSVEDNNETVVVAGNQLGA